MARKFTLFHLSLIPLRQLDVETKNLSREDWLRECLSESFPFPYRNDQDLNWVYKGELEGNILGLIQCLKPHKLHRSPEEGGDEYISEEWQGAYVLIDPEIHDEGQRIAVENDLVGKPTSLLAKLTDHLNSKPERPFNIHAHQIFNGGDFWAFSNKHEGVLKSITFNFTAPNMWHGRSNLEEDLRETAEETGGDRVIITLSGKEGITTAGQKVKDGVEFTSTGGGAVKAKALNGETFTSEDQPRITEIPSFSGDDASLLVQFKSVWKKVLGRD